MAEMKICPYCGEEILAVAKKCKHCGEWFEENEAEKPKEQVPCPICGEMIDEDVVECPFCHEKVAQATPEEVEHAPIVTSHITQNTPTYEEEEEQEEVHEGLFTYYFLDAIKNHYADFSRCATRKEFWMYVLFNYLVQFALMCLAFINFTFAIVVSSIYSLAILIPSLAMAVARLRDINKKWTNLFFSLIPIVGPIILLVFMCREGEKKNRKGTKMAVLDYVIIVLAIVGMIAFNVAQVKLINQLFSNEMGTMDIYSALLGGNEGGSKIKMPDVEALVEVTTEEANLRTGPGVDYTECESTMRKGYVLVAFEQQNGWWHVYTDNENTAWISSSATRVVDTGPIPIDKYGKYYNLPGYMDNFTFYKLSEAGKYNGLVICYTYDQWLEGTDRYEQSCEIQIGESVANGLVFPYSIWVLTGAESQESESYRVTIEPGGEFLTTLPGKRDSEGYWTYDIAPLSTLSEDAIGLLLSKATYNNDAYVITNDIIREYEFSQRMY